MSHSHFVQSTLSLAILSFLFFFNDTATTEIYTLSLHDALPICFARHVARVARAVELLVVPVRDDGDLLQLAGPGDLLQEPIGMRHVALDLERSEEHTSELQSRLHLVCRLLLEKKKNNIRDLARRNT